ncbi:hypothetical protein AcW1_008001 [Taiwanofungus camphoratus]|nr:hypothetical protein AcW1_008001 [Antrodia cinnamomea]
MILQVGLTGMPVPQVEIPYLYIFREYLSFLPPHMCFAIREDTGRLRAYATEHNLRQIELEEGTGSDPESLPDEEAREHWIRMEVFKHITTRLRHDPKTSTDKLASGWKGQLQGVACITTTSPADAHMIGLMDNQSEMKELLRTTPSVALKEQGS